MKLSYDETGKLLAEIDQKSLDTANGTIKVLCIAENWCGDCANGVPVIARLAEEMDQWDFKIAARDDHEELVELYYTTAGRKKIPVIVFADEDGDEICRWTERPLRSYQLLKELMEKKLPKEEYMSEYRKNPELKPPQVTENILTELLNLATRAATITAILPKKR